jgi:hypothetical protein
VSFSPGYRLIACFVFAVITNKAKKSSKIQGSTMNLIVRLSPLLRSFPASRPIHPYNAHIGILGFSLPAR